MIIRLLYALAISGSLTSCMTPLEETKRDLKELEKVEEDGVILIDDIEGIKI